MTNLTTARLVLVPLSRSMIERRLAEDSFDFWIEHVGIVTFPDSWPGDAFVMFPTFLSWGTEQIADTRVAVDPGAQSVVGQLGTTSALSAEGAIEIGYGFGVEGHGFATEALGAFVADLFGRASVRLVTAETAVWNIASQRVLEKNEFVRTGTSHSEADGDLITWERHRSAD